MSLCSEAELRAAMTDAEFWEHCFGGAHYIEPGDPDPAHEAIDAELTAQRTPCPECGEFGACGYDTEGRPLIHAISAEGDDA